MQCSAKPEQQGGDQAGQRTDPGAQESCEAGELSGDTGEKSGQDPGPDPVSRHSTRPLEEKQTENIKEQNISESQHNDNSQQYSNLGNNNTFQSKFHSFEGQIPSQQLGGKVSESGLQQQQPQSAVGRSEVAQNTDQFSHLNGGRVQQHNIDQYSSSQQFEPGQSYQCAINPRHNNVRSRSVQHQPQHPFNSNQHPANFLFHGQVSGAGPAGPGGQDRGFIPPGQQNFPSPPSFYPGGGPGHHQHPSYNGLHPHHQQQQNFGAGPNCFQVNFPHGRGGHHHQQTYEDGSEDLDSGNNAPSGAVSGPGPAPGHNNPHCHQFSLRARRRVRQRVDAGEPRNSYSSIPGFSFRHQNMMSRHYGGADDYGGLYRGGGFSLRGRGARHQAPPGGGPYNAHLPPGPLSASRYRHPVSSLLHPSHPPSLPMAAAAAVHRALFLGQGGVTAGSGPGPGLTRGVGRGLSGPVQPGLAPAGPSGDDTKTVQSLLRDETSERLDVLPPLITTPPTTPPTLVDSENTKVKISSSEGVSEPTHASAASDNNNQQQQSPTISNNNNNIQEYSTTFSKNALLIRELLSTKLAAVTDMMEQGFGLVAAHNGPRDFSQHSLPINNNDLKENAAQIMSHLLKVRQEMALNMSKDSDSDRHTESPGHISDNDIIEEEKEEPINLHQNSGSDGEASPASPSSDAGNSTGSAKDQKASRLENIVGGLARSTSSPLPPQGCKKRKLYQPVQHDVNEDELKENEKREEPEQKKLKDGIENHIKSMQDQFQKMHQKMYNNHNDENADPEDSSELQIDLSQEDKKFNKEEITIEKRLNPKPFASLAHPLLNGSAEPLPIPPSPLNPNYMDLAKRFLQERQDQVTKEMITRDIVESTIGKNEIAEKLKAISPELEGLADILKSELKTSLTIIVDSIVQKYLTQKRQPLSKFSENSFFNQEPRNKTPSGRAPQVRDRSTPRTIQQPVSMANPSSLSNSLANTNNLVMTGSIASQQPRISFPAPVSGDLALAQKPPMMTALYPGLGGQISDEEKDDESEQDDALNLTVTPKKKRHKVTDTRITPRTVSRLLGEQPSMADLHKHFGPGGPFMAPGFLPRPPFPGPLGSFLPNIPTSLPISHPGDHFPFSPFGFPGPLRRDASPPSSRPRSASPPRDPRPPPPLIHPALLAAQSPDFPHHMRHIQDQDMGQPRPSSEAGSDDMKMDFGSSPFSLGNMSGE